MQIERGNQNAESATRGAFIETIHCGRQMRAYAIFESEIESIGSANAHVTFWTGVAAASLALLVGCLWDMIGMTAVSKTQETFAYGCGAVTLLATCAALWQFFKRRSLIKRIKDETIDPKASSTRQ